MHHVARVLLLAGALGPAALAASHREAPAIALDSRADSTDVYVFRSYEPGRADKLIALVNYLPMQEPAGNPTHYTFPNYYSYNLHFDNDGDAVADFRFTVKPNVQYTPPSVTTDDGTETESPLIYRFPGPISGRFDSALGVREIYLLELTTEVGTFPVTNTTIGSTAFFKPIDNVGNEAFAAGYAAFARQFVFDFETFDGTDIVTGRTFVGQRLDSFSMDHDAIYGPDAGGAAALHSATAQTGNDSHFGHNVLSVALELPLSYLTDNGTNTTLGVWATTSVPQTRVLNGSPTHAGDVVVPPGSGDPRVQVSRLGWPFTNMLLIGVNSKDRFNALSPDTDLLEFEQFLLNPAYAALRGYPSSDRTDLRDVILFGVPGVNQTVGSGDMLRLDTTVLPTAAGDQNPLGLLGSPPDPAGFPNGRRPGDDVTDIWLRILQGFYLGGAGPFDATDGVPVLATQFLSEFPFLLPPLGRDEEPTCVVLTSSTTPDAASFQPVQNAFVDPGNPSRVITMLTPEDLVFYMVESQVDVNIDTVNRIGEVLEFVLSLPGGST